MKTTYSKLVSAAVMTLAYFVTFSCEAGQFTLEIVQPSTGPDHQGTLRVMYHDEDDNFSFYNGGLHLQLSSSVGGVIKFHGGEIINSDERWAVAYVRDVADNSIGNLFAASLLTPGLTGTGSRIFADFQYSLIGSGSTELIIDAGGEDPVVEGPLGDIAHHVSSRGLCMGDCLPDYSPTVLNLGESWAQKSVVENPPPTPVIVPAPIHVPASSHPPIASNPNAAKFSFEIVKPSTGPDDPGTLQIVFEEGDENYAFFNGGLHLQVSSSNSGVIKFLGGEVFNDDDRWSVGTVRDVEDNSIGNLLAASVMTPGLVGVGPRTFAQIQYSLIGSGSTELLIEAGGEDPVVEGPLGEISHLVYSHGFCLGDCLPDYTPTVLNLGENWAQKRDLINPPPPAIPIPAPVWNPPVVVSPEDFELEEDVPPSYYEPEESTPPLADDTSTPDPDSWFPGETVNDSPLVVTPVEILAPDTEIEDAGVVDTDSPVVIEIEQPNFDITYWQVIPVFSVVDGVVVQINTADGSVMPVVDSWFTRRNDFTGRLKSISEDIIANLRAQIIKTQTTSMFDLDVTHFGTTGILAFSSSGTTVPEPSGFFLALASAAAILMRRRLA
jgi:hypothetical protein